MFHILFVCTHNRCRSILCEAIVGKRGQGMLQTSSAGSQPEGQVHPLTLKYLEEAGYVTEGLSSKGWDALAADPPDLVVTVCDSAAGEACPLWLGETERFHWPLADPSKAPPPEQAQQFRQTITLIESSLNGWLERARAHQSS